MGRPADKNLLVTSDDFGMCHSINLGIAKAMTQGIVRSTNFIAPCAWFDEAVALAKVHRLNAGVHLTLTSEWDRMRWGPLTPARSLRDASGNFCSSYDELIRQAKEHEVLEEYRAQILKVKACGIRPTHVETHMLGGSEAGPGAMFVPLVRRIAAEFGLIYTYDRQDGHWRYFNEVYMVSLKSAGEFIQWLEGLKPGRYHAIGHAAVESDELASMGTSAAALKNWITTRPSDLAIFTDPAVRETLERHGIELIDVRAVADAAGAGRVGS